MSIAIPVSRGRVSPVLDVAERFLLLGSQENTASAHEILLEATDLVSRAKQLADLRVETVICGAVSCQMEDLLAAVGIEVVSGACGDIESIVAALRNGEFDAAQFAMPGYCRGTRQRRRVRCRRFRGPGYGAEEQS